MGELALIIVMRLFNQSTITLTLIIMLEGIVEKIVQKLLGEYIDGFDSNNLHIGIWSGEVTIKNVRLKKTVLQKLGLPLELKYSIIQHIVLKIHDLLLL